jgi:predicted HTH domain antitoxin
MHKDIQITYPESLANSLKLSLKDFENEMKMSALAKLFELGKVSSGTAAKVMGISRIEFLDKLSAYQVSLFQYTNLDDLNEDLANA